MLFVNPKKKRMIEKVYRDGNALVLEQESGIIRIVPQNERMVRVSYTENGKFEAAQGAQFTDLSASCEWNYEEGADNVVIRCKELIVKVNRASGSIVYERPDGSLLLAERKIESKCVEQFDSYRMVLNENAKIEKVQTPDGVKLKVIEAERVFDRKLYHTKLHLTFAEDEKLFGLGQAEEGVWNLRGTTQYLHQANLKIAVPLLLSSKGYGILLSTESPAMFTDTQYGSYLYTEADEYLDYYLIAGTPDEVVDGVRALSGKAVMLPKWAFGYTQSMERYETAEELIATAKKFRELGFGMDTLVLDWLSWPDNQWGQKSFDETRFPDPTGMMEQLHELDTHLMMSIWPNMANHTDNHQEFLKEGLMLPASEVYNALSEEGRKLYWEQVNRALFVHGLDGWWCDSSEPITPEWTRRSKPEPAEMYYDFVKTIGNCMPIQQGNAYGLYHAQALYEGQRATDESRRVINLTRSGYTGSQKYGTILWSGDTYASWDTLRKQIPAGLQFCACGLPYWTLDIGAFFIKNGSSWFWNGDYDGGIEDPAYRELYTRWFQYGAFLPMFRSHGTEVRREPWHYGEPGDMFYDAMLAANRLRYRLMPYIYSLAAEVWRENGTMMRMLAFDFGKDEKALEIADQYMFGPALMVCPVTEPMYYNVGGAAIEDAKKSRIVYLPEGFDWYDLRTYERYAGGQYIEAAADISSIPVFVKAGSIIPTTEPGDSTTAIEGQDITLFVYAGADGEFTLYEDAGDGYGYEQGEYCLTKIHYNDKERKVSWESEGDLRFRKGNIQIEIIG